MSLNAGQVLERVVRQDRMGISELSRKLSVSRRTIYNWFDQKSLNPEIIWKVGAVIGHDFSVELPETFTKHGNRLHEALNAYQRNDSSKTDSNSVYFWMNKYIHLLEKYNELLSHVSPQTDKEEIVLNHSKPRNNVKEFPILP
ncbi:hypothetical protein [Pedobacter agri]|uniref:hypothetical protein n=1 Tax=Pedobacter agri TaxID=454586 RepID=UPI002930B315|nr:hypothetical protein [Pedobacter agri]